MSITIRIRKDTANRINSLFCNMLDIDSELSERASWDLKINLILDKLEVTRGAKHPVVKR